MQSSYIRFTALLRDAGHNIVDNTTSRQPLCYSSVSRFELYFRFLPLHLNSVNYEQSQLYWHTCNCPLIYSVTMLQTETFILCETHRYQTNKSRKAIQSSLARAVNKRNQHYHITSVTPLAQNTWTYSIWHHISHQQHTSIFQALRQLFVV